MAKKKTVARKRQLTALALRAQQMLAARPARIDPEQDYSVDEAALLMCASVSVIYRMARTGLLKFKKRGRRTRVSGAEILRANAVEQQ